MMRLTTVRRLSAQDDVPHEEDARTRHTDCMSSLSISCDESLYQPMDVGQDVLGQLSHERFEYYWKFEQSTTEMVSSRTYNATPNHI